MGTNSCSFVPDPFMVVHEAENEVSFSRKRTHEDGAEDFINNYKLQYCISPLPPLVAAQFHQKTNNPMIIPQQSTAPLIPAGLRLSMDNFTTPPPGRAKPINANINNPCSTSTLADEFHSQYLRQREEIGHTIKIQGERMRQALEEKRQRHTRTLLALVEERLLTRVLETDAELKKVTFRNSELEERVKQLSVEAQLWQSLARNNEAMVCSLRSNLEQAVAQSREQIITKEGCGDSEDDDAASCVNGESGDHANHHHHQNAITMIKENKELHKQRNCRACESRDACILLLPCRHLCLCKECDAYVSQCHICGYSKNASVQVYMD